MSVVSIVLLTSFLQAQFGSIEGTVKTRAGLPIAKAAVTLQPSRQGSSIKSITSSDGRFFFPTVPPGQYNLTAKRNGYADAEYGRRGANGSGTSITVVRGANLRDVNLTMTAYGTLSGRILDADGEPIVAAAVQALRYSYTNGRRTLTETRTVTTNDRGEYRLFWLSPGKYYIRCGGSTTASIGVLEPRAGAAVRQSLPMEADGTLYAPVYFPGTSDPQAAAGVALTPGADYSGVDFTLSASTARRVRVTVIDPSGAHRNTGLTLAPRNPAGPLDMKRSVAYGDGQGQFTSIPPGSYILTATLQQPAGSSTRRMGTSIPIEVRNSDVDVSLTLAPAIDITGRVIVQGLRSGSPDHHPIVSVVPLGNLRAQGINDFADFHGNDTFDLGDVVEGDYSLLIEDIAKDQYLKSVRFGSTDVLAEGFHVDSRGSGTLEIVLGADGGALSGTAVDTGRQPAANVSVTLVPDESHRNRDDLYKTVSTDASGRFSLQAIAPGVYTVFAWEDVDPANLYDADFVRSFQAQGRTVHVSESSNESITLVAIPDGY